MYIGTFCLGYISIIDIFSVLLHVFWLKYIWMNLYLRYFDSEVFAYTLDEAFDFPQSIPEVDLDEFLMGDIAQYVESSNMYPKRNIKVISGRTLSRAFRENYLVIIFFYTISLCIWIHIVQLLRILYHKFLYFL